MILLQLIVLYLSSISQVTALLAYRFLAQTSDEFIQAKFSEKITREDAVMRLSESQLGKNSERHIVPVKNGPTTLTVIEDRQVDKSLEESIEDNGGILDCLTFSPGVEIPLQKFEYLPASRFENGYPIILPEEVSRKNYDDFSVLKVLRNAIALYDNSECQYDAIGLLAGNPIRVTPPLEGSPVLSIGVITPLVAEDWLKNGIQRYTPQWHSKIVVNLSEDEITALSKFKIQATEPTSSPRRKTPTKYSSPQKKLKNQSENGSDDESVSNMLAKLKLKLESESLNKKTQLEEDGLISFSDPKRKIKFDDDLLLPHTNKDDFDFDFDLGLEAGGSADANRIPFDYDSAFITEQQYKDYKKYAEEKLEKKLQLDAQQLAVKAAGKHSVLSKDEKSAQEDL